MTARYVERSGYLQFLGLCPRDLEEIGRKCGSINGKLSVNFEGRHDEETCSCFGSDRVGWINVTNYHALAN